jgi:transcriptional regulator with XRE-family HTH domain
MTQTELADALGTHYTSISHVERGLRGLTIQQLVKLARALRVSTDDILFGPRANKEKVQPMNGRLLRRLQRIGELPRAEQRFLLKMVEGRLEKYTREKRRALKPGQ